MTPLEIAAGLRDAGADECDVERFLELTDATSLAITAAFGAPPGPTRIVLPAALVADVARRREDARLLAAQWLDDVSVAMRRGTPLDVLRESQRIRESVRPGRQLCRAKARQIRRQIREVRA